MGQTGTSKYMLLIFLMLEHILFLQVPSKTNSEVKRAFIDVQTQPIFRR